MGKAAYVLAAWIAASAAHAASPTPARVPAAQPDFGGMWQVQFAYSVGLRPMSPADGAPTPFLPWTKAIAEAAAKSTAAGDPWPSNSQRCLPAGFVRAAKGNFPWILIQTEKQIVVLFEEDNRVSQIPFAAAHKKDLRPSWYGDPIARWDGDALVIDTVGYNEKTPLPLAIFHTPALHTVERLRLINDGKTLEDRVTIDDPGAFLRPWEAVVLFNRRTDNYKLIDYRCAENNHELPPTGLWGPD